MANSNDFRATQIQTNKLIVTGSNARSSQCLLVYGHSAQGTPGEQGIINQTYFPTSSIGSDAFVYFSGSVGSRGTTNPGAVIFAGDIHISGNLSVDGTTPGAAETVWFSAVANKVYTTGSVEVRNITAADPSLVVTGSTVLGGLGSYATGSSVAQGESTTATGLASFSHGQTTTASGDYSHAEGFGTTASGTYSHTEGSSTVASANNAHAEGSTTTASGISSHAEGDMTTASGMNAHAEGSGTTASGDASHAEGSNTTASGMNSHAEGDGTIANGPGSHAEGSFSITEGANSHASGIRTIASGSGQFVAGKYNLRSNDFSLFVVGNGTDDADVFRSDIFRVNSGSVEVTGSFVSPQITGSLSGTVAGSPFLAAGSNITTNYNSLGQWEISSSGGGATNGTGAYASRPASPAIGDTYTVTTGSLRGSVYHCQSTGVWKLITLAVPELSSCLGLFDGESIQGRVGTNIRRWNNLAPKGDNSDLVYFAGNTDCPAAASPVSGVIVHNTTTRTVALQANIPAPGALGPRSVATLVKPGTSIATTYNHVISWGEVSKTAGMLSICSRAAGVDNWGNHYWGSGRDTGTAVSSSVWAAVVVTYDGADVRYYLDDNGLGATLIDTHTFALSGDPSAANFSVNARIGDGEYAQAETAFAAAWEVCLTGSDVSTLTSLLRERYGV